MKWNEEQAPITPRSTKSLLDSIEFKFSSNYSPKSNSPEFIVLHHTGSTSFNGTVSWLCDSTSKVSAHFVIGTDGKIIQLVKLQDAAWHAGKSEWTIDGHKYSGLNNYSIGIELVNVGKLSQSNGKFYYELGTQQKEWLGNRPTETSITYSDNSILTGYFVEYPPKQLDALASLCKELAIKMPNLTRNRVLTHYQVASPIGRKNDPFGLDLNAVLDKIYGR